MEMIINLATEQFVFLWERVRSEVSMPLCHSGMTQRITFKYNDQIFILQCCNLQCFLENIGK